MATWYGLPTHRRVSMYDGWGSASYAQVRDTAGNLFELSPGKATLLQRADGSSANYTYTPTSPNWDAVVQALAAANPAVDVFGITGAASSGGSGGGIVSTLQSLWQQQTPEQQEQLLSTAASYAPSIWDRIRGAVGGGSDLESLYAKLARAQQRYATTTSASKRAKYAAEIQSLQAQIASLEANQAAAATQLAPAAPSSSPFTAVLVPVAVGGLLLAAMVGGAVLLTRKRSRR